MFLRKADYNTLIKSDNLDVVTGSDDDLISECELAAQAEVESYLRHRYNVAIIFKDLFTYSHTTRYNEGDLVAYSEAAYDTTATYNTDDRCSYSGYIYKATEDGVTGAWNAAKWTQVCENDLLYYCRSQSTGNYPSGTAFTYSVNAYTNGHDKITGWDRTTTLYVKRDDDQIKFYESAADRTNDANSIGYIVYSEDELQLPKPCEIKNRIVDYENGLGGELILNNFVPDDTEWTIAASNYWTQGDNRNQQIKMYVIDIVLYHIHARIQPRMIPELRGIRRDNAIEWLKKIARGEITADLPLNADENKGQEIAWGSNKKTDYQKY